MVYQKSVPVVPIQIKFDDWSPDTCLLNPKEKPTEYQRKISRGRVVTETITEYKDIGDLDSDFGNFDFGRGFPAFANLRLRDGGNAGDDAGDNDGDADSAKSGSPLPSSSDEDDEPMDAFQAQNLKVHNDMREKHGVGPLKMSQELCDYAQEWADQLAASDNFQHRSNNKYGENLYMSWSSNQKAKVPGSVAAESWYSEVAQHTFGQEPMSMGTGHFTQMVWKGTHKMGVAKARSATGKVIVVANYEPAGNIIGHYTKNVLAPK